MIAILHLIGFVPVAVVVMLIHVIRSGPTRRGVSVGCHPREL